MNEKEPTFRLRRARRGDAVSIRRLVRGAFLNPFGVDWRRFIVAEGPDGDVIGAGQLKPHGGGLTELASIVVHPDWQMFGIGTRIVAVLVEEADPPLWLTCRKELVGFYARFGFGLMDPSTEAPRLLRALAWIGRFLARRFPGLNRPNVMLLPADQSRTDSKEYPLG
jgi:N-acetylglutamate synthase-like GNAT family acetyltransferase